MTTYFITRHPGALEWAAQEGLTGAECIAHLDLAHIGPGDRVIGTLPVNLAAEVCAKGARYLHLSLRLPAEARGTELSAEEMRRYGASLREYRIEPVD